MSTSNLTPVERIGKAVSWYQSLPAGYDNLETLLDAARRFACAVFDFSEEVGALYKQRNRTEHNRKSAFVMEFRALMSSDPKPSAAAAEKEADALCLSLRGEEQQADAEYRAAMLILESAKAVHDQMRQHISNLKQEKRAEFTGQGAQQ